MSICTPSKGSESLSKLPGLGAPLVRLGTERQIGQSLRPEQQSNHCLRTRWFRISGLASALMLAAIILSCGGLNVQSHIQDLCNCLPLEPDAVDYRHAAKHVPLPNITPQEITVATILSWPQTPFLAPDAPRSGRELQLFHVTHVFLQNASVNAADCDVNLEISATPERNAPRVIVETPVDSEYCTARQQIQSQLAQHGFKLDIQSGGELPQPLICDVTGMAFEDFEHNRGSGQVATLWELHPATVIINQ